MAHVLRAARAALCAVHAVLQGPGTAEDPAASLAKLQSLLAGGEIVLNGKEAGTELAGGSTIAGIAAAASEGAEGLNAELARLQQLLTRKEAQLDQQAQLLAAQQDAAEQAGRELVQLKDQLTAAQSGLQTSSGETESLRQNLAEAHQQLEERSAALKAHAIQVAGLEDSLR